VSSRSWSFLLLRQTVLGGIALAIGGDWLPAKTIGR